MSARLSRRDLIKGAGGLALALPLLPSLARAEGVFPRRFIAFFHPNGVLPSQWFPAPSASETDFTFAPSLQPLEPFRSHVLQLQGVDMKCTAPGPGEPHQKGMGAVLTGWHLNEGNMVGGDGSLAGWARGISIDQRIAQVLGQGTRLGSLLLGIRSKGGDVRHHMSYGGDDQPLPVIDDPVQAFSRAFAGFVGSDPELDLIRQRRASVLDAVRGQLTELNRRLPAEERTQLNQHLALVRDLEMRLAATINGASCAKPAEPNPMTPDSAATMPEVAQLQTDLLVMAMACDITRVGSLQFSQGQNHINFPWLNSTWDGHALSHLGPSDPARPEIGVRDRWYAERFAYLLERLGSIPEGEATMLDHTLVFWVNELSEGYTHSHVGMPFVLAGGAAGFRMGRCVRYSGASHSNLLLSILHGMGVNDATFGNPDFTSGELPGLT
jgi:hypothetical protein